MKRNFEKTMTNAVKKQKRHHRHIRKLKFSTYKEDFVLTEQEEKEGGFFGSASYKPVSS